MMLNNLGVFLLENLSTNRNVRVEMMIWWGRGFLLVFVPAIPPVHFCHCPDTVLCAYGTQQIRSMAMDSLHAGEQ